MSVAAIEAQVVNGQVRLPPNVKLPENSTVYVVVPDSHAVSSPIKIMSPKLVHPEQAVDLRKTLVEEKT